MGAEHASCAALQQQRVSIMLSHAISTGLRSVGQASAGRRSISSLLSSGHGTHWMITIFTRDAAGDKFSRLLKQSSRQRWCTRAPDRFPQRATTSPFHERVEIYGIIKHDLEVFSPPISSVDAREGSPVYHAPSCVFMIRAPRVAGHIFSAFVARRAFPSRATCPPAPAQKARNDPAR